MLPLQKQSAVHLSVWETETFLLENERRSGGPTEIGSIELMRVTENDQTLTTREVASKLRRTHGASHSSLSHYILITTG